MSIQERENFGFSFELDDFQVEAINHINNQQNVVVCAPTGAARPSLPNTQ